MALVGFINVALAEAVSPSVELQRTSCRINNPAIYLCRKRFYRFIARPAVSSNDTVYGGSLVWRM